ncbi:hypothetical protein AVEN_57334-1 [Araneus ventricosus]|uniref:Uncharacterized protein n=1 Tax=Araneus ventricosus TaxID=182803 RepID=A0A4Y2IP65_ARAVE|nr:hypothetical protein AVEN_57334-1 [Araneus ventricosus]
MHSFSKSPMKICSDSIMKIFPFSWLTFELPYRWMGNVRLAYRSASSLGPRKGGGNSCAVKCRAGGACEHPLIIPEVMRKMKIHLLRLDCFL